MHEPFTAPEKTITFNGREYRTRQVWLTGNPRRRDRFKRFLVPALILAIAIHLLVDLAYFVSAA